MKLPKKKKKKKKKKRKGGEEGGGGGGGGGANLPVFGDPSSVFLHGGGRTHAIEQLEFLALLLNHLPSRFRVTCKHSSQHHKIGTSTKRLGYITRTRTASILIKEGIIGVIVKSIYIGVTVLSVTKV